MWCSGWVRPEAAESAAHDFERVLQAEVARRKFEPPVSSAVHRRTYAFGLAATSDVRVVLSIPASWGCTCATVLRSTRTCAGEACSATCPSPNCPRCSASWMKATRRSPLGPRRRGTAGVRGCGGARGLDRVVPIGEALAFDVVWDGFHLIDDVLRRVRVRRA